MADSLIIETSDLRKRYDSFEALRGLNLAVPAGSIFGFLGRNGAGKTTTMKILLGMTHPTSGVARVFGRTTDDIEIRRRTAFVSEEKDLYDSMTVAEMIRFTAGFYPNWRRDLEQKYLHRFELPRDRKIKALSKGMRTKLALLLAFARGAELLILDEPTSGLDPAMSEEVLQAIVGHVANEGLTVFFSSHQIAEVDQIADHVAVIARGATVVSGGLDDVRERYRRIQLVFAGQAPVYTFAKGVISMRREGRMLSLLSSNGIDAVVDEARTLNPVSVDVVPVSLKEIFLETTEGN